MNFSTKIEEYLKEAEEKGDLLRKEKVFYTTINDLLNQTIQWVVNELVATTGSTNVAAYQVTRAHPCIQKLIGNMLALQKEQNEMTVGNLISILSKLDQTRPFVLSCHVSCVTDSGTDMGDFEDHVITDIRDLESRVVITIGRKF